MAAKHRSHINVRETNTLTELSGTYGNEKIDQKRFHFPVGEIPRLGMRTYFYCEHKTPHYMGLTLNPLHGNRNHYRLSRVFRGYFLPKIFDTINNINKANDVPADSRQYWQKCSKTTPWI